MNWEEEVKKNRKPDYEIDPIFLNRWSPRAMTGESLTEEEFMPLFEAARWAPSSGNLQQWRFVYAKRDTEHWQKFFDLLVEGNKLWCKNAALLVMIISKNTSGHNRKLDPTHAFDTGSAWENLALEGARRRLVVHGMAGFDYVRAREVFNLSEDYFVQAMFAIGKRAPKESLPEKLLEREVPSTRKPVSEFVFEGYFFP